MRRLGAQARSRILAISAESYSVQAGQLLLTVSQASELRGYRPAARSGAFFLRSSRSRAAPKPSRARYLAIRTLPAETQRPATAIARETSTVMRLSRAMFVKMLESYPDAAVRMRELIVSRADQWTREIENVRAALARGTGPRS